VVDIDEEDFFALLSGFINIYNILLLLVKFFFFYIKRVSALLKAVITLASYQSIK